MFVNLPSFPPLIWQSAFFNKADRVIPAPYTPNFLAFFPGKMIPMFGYEMSSYFF